MIVGKQINSLQKLIDITIINKKSVLVKVDPGHFEQHGWKFVANSSLKSVVKMLNKGVLFEYNSGDK